MISSGASGGWAGAATRLRTGSSPLVFKDLRANLLVRDPSLMPSQPTRPARAVRNASASRERRSNPIVRSVEDNQPVTIVFAESEIDDFLIVERPVEKLRLL